MNIIIEQSGYVKFNQDFQLSQESVTVNLTPNSGCSALIPTAAYTPISVIPTDTNTPTPTSTPTPTFAPPDIYVVPNRISKARLAAFLKISVATLEQANPGLPDPVEIDTIIVMSSNHQ